MSKKNEYVRWLEDLTNEDVAALEEGKNSSLGRTGEDDVPDACRKGYTTLFTDRAMAYRAEKGFDHFDVALSGLAIGQGIRTGKIQVIRSVHDIGRFKEVTF